MNLDGYLEQLVHRVFKILPLFEEQNIGLPIYIESLIYELLGGDKVLDDTKFLSVAFSLEALLYVDDPIIIRRKVFEIIDIVKKIRGGETDGICR